ncbi:MAG: hypothetical protein U5K37_08230 [Natrialbaceae archaeon]|nr:hypothetical protein [Natrialbaceae archaeon]
MHRGDEEALRTQLDEAREFIEDGGLDHRYKSLFGRSAASQGDVEALLEFLEAQS